MDPSRDAAPGLAFLSPKANDLDTRMVLRYYGNCTRPARLRHAAGSLDLELAVRCRSCPGCLRARQHLWRLRAELEVLQRPSYFFTGTFRDQYLDREPIAEEVTKYLKRLRHAVPSGTLRYLIVPERHKSGAWHVHGLVHVLGGLRYEALRKPWSAGHAWVVPAKVESAGYVTKYVTKDLLDERTNNNLRRPRIRASRDPRYGASVMVHEAELLAAMQRKEVTLTDTWTTNLKALLQSVEMNGAQDPLWQALISVNKNGRLISNGKEVDRETGEILQYHSRQAATRRQ